MKGVSYFFRNKQQSSKTNFAKEKKNDVTGIINKRTPCQGSMPNFTPCQRFQGISYHIRHVHFGQKS